MAEEPTQTQKDTAAAASRLNTDNRAQSTNEATQRDTQRAQDRTQGGTGADKLQRRIASQENPQQQETLFVELQTPMTSGSIALPSFQGIVCVDGVPFEVTVNGIIGEEA